MNLQYITLLISAIILGILFFMKISEALIVAFTTRSSYGTLPITISSIGIAGVHGAATISATVVLSSLGLPIEGLAMILGIDVVVDMIRTMTNVTGAAVASILVASTENELDVDAFNKSDVKKELNAA